MLTHKGTKTIITERLILRQFRVDDANDMFVWASNPEVVKYLSYKPHTSSKATAELLKGWVSGYNSNEVYNWAIELKGTVVGSISVVDSDNDSSCCHLGWQIDEPFWNKGYMTEAANAIVNFLFSEVGYNRIQSGHDTRNIGSGRVMEKIGMSLEGTLRQYCHQKDGSIGDKHLWAILKSDWEKNKNINKNDKIIADISNFIFVSDTPRKVDAIFLPGGSHPEQPEYAAELYKRGFTPICIVSGGVSVKKQRFDGVKSKADIYNGNYKTDCEFLTDALNKNGVPLEQIYGEDMSGHSRDNAFFSKKVADENGLSIKTAIIVCKAFHARRCLMLYSLAFPDTKFYVCPVVCMGITKDNWYKSEQGIDRVLGELARCGNQFVGDIKEYLL